MVVLAAGTLAYWIGRNGTGGEAAPTAAVDRLSDPGPGPGSETLRTDAPIPAELNRANAELESGTSSAGVPQLPETPTQGASLAGELRWVTELGNDGVGQLVGARRNGKKHGVWRHYGDDGILLSESNFSDGKLDGKDTAFERSGQVKEITEYRAGKLHGISKAFYSNGHPWVVTRYENGQRTECWIEYNRDGTIKNEGIDWDPAVEQ